MRVLLTGANGFIGFHVAQYLSKASIEVLATGHSQKPRSSRHNYISWDISDPLLTGKVIDFAKDCDTVVHLAASLPGKTYEQLISTNCRGTANVLEVANSLPHCRSFVYLSSVPVIGTPKLLPITEEHPVSPPSTYHLTKYFGEEYISLNARPELNIATLRIPSPVGHGMNPKTILPVFLEKCRKNEDIPIAGRGTRTQNYLDVRDIAQAIKKAASTKSEGVYLIASPKGYSNLELANLCREKTGSSSQIVFSGISDPQEGLMWGEISCEKARLDFGYESLFNLHETIDWILNDNK